MNYLWLLSLVFVFLQIQCSKSDCFLHNPRGSNNRLNEDSANRDNSNRLFDSQNNNRGGYNVGDLDTEEGFNADNWMAEPALMYDFEFFFENDAGHERQYEMLYFEESYLSITWTIDQGMANKKLNSHIILQFICDTFERADAATDNSFGFGPSGDIPTAAANSTLTQEQLLDMKKHGLRAELYNGGNTNTPDSTNDVNDITNTYQSNHNNERGRRESEEFYYLCQQRLGNGGLFIADQDLNGDSQIYTRQNPDGTRRGLECPEERDYYPYWHPSPFHDIAIITSDVDYCESDIAPYSQNVFDKYQCVKDTSSSSAGTIDDPEDYLADEDYIIYNNDQTSCESESGAAWEGFSWNSIEPECVEASWSKTNYPGNAGDNIASDRGGMQPKYDWKIPTMNELINNHYCWEYTYSIDSDEYITNATSGSVNGDDININCVRMMFRIRYNVTSMDYDPYKTDWIQNYIQYVIDSPVETNPNVDAGVYAQGLRLALNTERTGRVFEDSSHTFLVCEKPSTASWANADYLFNVNVRGKRGNIVQAFPAVEYDFEPKHIEIANDECMHFQWTGSNTHNNGNPAGDGQAGDGGGEGRGGSDRTNIVEMFDMKRSYPIPYDKIDDDFFDNVDCSFPLFPDIDVSADDARIILGTAGFYNGLQDAKYQIENGDNEDGLLDPLLNNVSATFRQGLICCVKSNAVASGESKSFAFLSTRNNNFSNRAQKLMIKIINSMDDTDISTW